MKTASLGGQPSSRRLLIVFARTPEIADHSLSVLVSPSTSINLPGLASLETASRGFIPSAKRLRIVLDLTPVSFDHSAAVLETPSTSIVRGCIDTPAREPTQQV